MKINYWRLAVTIILGLYFTNCIIHLSDWHFMDNVNLIIHEAGHFVFIFFGEFISVLGGSFLQVFLPVVFAGYFFHRQDYFSVSVLLYWVGYSIINVSVYMGDAIAMQLPLLGGDSSIHDWNYLFTNLGLLSHTHNLAASAYGIGLLVISCAIGMGLKNSLVYEDGDKKGFFSGQ